MAMVELDHKKYRLPIPHMTTYEHLIYQDIILVQLKIFVSYYLIFKT